MLSKFKENMIAAKYWKNYDGCDVIIVLFAQHSIKHYNTKELFLTSKKKPDNFFPDNESNSSRQGTKWHT